MVFLSQQKVHVMLQLTVVVIDLPSSLVEHNEDLRQLFPLEDRVSERGDSRKRKAEAEQLQANQHEQTPDQD